MPIRYNLNNRGAQVAYVATAWSKRDLRTLLEYGGRVTRSDVSPFYEDGDKAYMWSVLGKPGVDLARDITTKVSEWELDRADAFVSLNGHARKGELRERLVALEDGDEEGLAALQQEIAAALDGEPAPTVTRPTVTRADKNAAHIDRVRDILGVVKRVKLTDMAHALNGVSPAGLARLVAAERDLEVYGGGGRGKTRYIRLRP